MLPAIETGDVVQTWLNRKQAASYIERRTGVPITASVLAYRASMGTGPIYSMWGTDRPQRGGRGRYAVYRPEDLDAWIKTQISAPDRTTRELAAEAAGVLPGYLGA